MPNLAAAEADADTAPFLQVISQLSGGRVVTSDHSHLDMSLPSLHAVFLPKLPSMNLQNASPTITGFLYSIVSDQGIHFRAKGVPLWAHAHQSYIYAKSLILDFLASSIARK